MKLVWIAFALGGCDQLLELNEVKRPPIDAGTHDGSASDPCGAHDEDGDGYGDGCDLCPTVASLQPPPASQADGDADGVGDECDPRPGMPDQVEGFFTFTDEVGLAITGNVMQRTDYLALGDTGTIETTATFLKPVKITVGVNNLLIGETIVLTYDQADLAEKIDCEISTLACQGTVCLYAAQHGMATTTTLAISLSDVKTLTIYRDDQTVRCAVNDPTVSSSPPLPGPMPDDGAITVTVPIGPIDLPNLIIYGESQ